MQTEKQLTANLTWRDGQPYSTEFKDVYFSSDNGPAETEYVFLQGNHLAERFSALTTDTFTIIETGFGTGLNFLCVARLWLSSAPVNATLHFISLEKYPLSLPDMTNSHAIWPDLNAFSTPFLAQYQDLLDTETISIFENRIQLQMLWGDANTNLEHLTTKADAWFLDGFAPAKNPEMWQPSLFEQVARLSHTNTTFATFTSAGMVRRDLIAAGFTVEKQPGFGKKREMLTGYFTE